MLSLQSIQLTQGLNFDGDSGAVINKQLGDKLNIQRWCRRYESNRYWRHIGSGNVKLAKTLTGFG